MLTRTVVALCTLLAITSNAAAQTCSGDPVAIQILGSGGPGINPERASAGYLLWIGSQAKMLIDLGGGGFLRFGQSRAKLADLALVGITHLHPDHTSDVAALLWGSNRAREAALPVVGPSGNGAAPDVKTFLSRMFDAKSGSYPVLGSVLGADQPGSDRPPLDITVIDASKDEPTKVYDHDGITVTATRIPHTLPAIAFRVETGGVSVVFSSDQNGTNPKFIDFAKNADVLLMHMAIAAKSPPNPGHAAPAVVGRIAQQAGVKHLIVSHIGQFNLDDAISELKTTYSGPLTVGADLQCTQAK